LLFRWKHVFCGSSSVLIFGQFRIFTVTPNCIAHSAALAFNVVEEFQDIFHHHRPFTFADNLATSNLKAHLKSCRV